MTMTTLYPSGDGPFGTIGQAQIRYAGYTAAARGEFGPAARYNLGMLADTLDTAAVELGEFDLEVLARLAGVLGVVECAVLNSLIQRAAGDTYDDTVYVVSPDLPGAGR